MAETAAHRWNPVFRLAYGRDGRLKGGRLIAISAVAALVVAIGTTIAVVAAGAGSPGTLAVWTTVAFLGVKLPLLALLWWLLGRHVEQPGEHRWDADETREILRRLHQAALAASGRKDERSRLEALVEEAGFVAENAPSELTESAAAMVERIRSQRDSAAIPT